MYLQFENFDNCCTINYFKKNITDKMYHKVRIIERTDIE